MTIQELFQIIIFGPEYFLQIDNLIDVFSIYFIFKYCFTDPVDSNGKFDPDNEKLGMQYLSVGLFLVLTNLILQLSNTMKQLRITWIIIENSLK